MYRFLSYMLISTMFVLSSLPLWGVLIVATCDYFLLKILYSKTEEVEKLEGKLRLNNPKALSYYESKIVKDGFQISEKTEDYIVYRGEEKLFSRYSNEEYMRMTEVDNFKIICDELASKYSKKVENLLSGEDGWIDTWDIYSNHLGSLYVRKDAIVLSDSSSEDSVKLFRNTNGTYGLNFRASPSFVCKYYSWPRMKIKTSEFFLITEIRT